MLGFLLILSSVALFAAVCLNPKIGSVLIFPVVFLYPHLYMQQTGVLPWNIGIDDLFICLFFLIVLVRRNLLGGTPIRWGVALAGALAYLAVWTTANLSGWGLMPELEPIDVFKPILKYVVFVLYVYALIHTLDTGRDLRRIALAFSVFLTMAGIIVILHKWFPDPMRIFTSAESEQFRAWHGQVIRAVGPFLDPNNGGIVLSMAAVFTLVLAASPVAGWWKPVLLLCLPVLLVGVAMTESRTGALALTSTIALMCVIGRQRRYAVAVGLVVIAGAGIAPAIFMGIGERLAGIYNPEGGGQLAPSAQGRLWIWSELYRTASAQVWLFGQGRTVAALRLGLDAHSAYVGALFIHGIGGVVWATVFFGTLLRRIGGVSRTGTEPYRTIVSAAGWSFLVWAIAGLALDVIVIQACQYVYLFYAVLIQRAFALAHWSAAAEPMIDSNYAKGVAARGEVGRKARPSLGAFPGAGRSIR